MGVLGHVKKRTTRETENNETIHLPWIFEDILVGMVASILLVLSAEPDSGIQLVVLSIIAGYGGEAVLRSFDFVREQQANVQNSERQNKSPHD